MGTSGGGSPARAGTHQKRWDDAEDAAFLQALAVYGYGCWTQIARHLQTLPNLSVKRTPLQVKNRARHLILYDTGTELGNELKRLASEHAARSTAHANAAAPLKLYQTRRQRTYHFQQQVDQEELASDKEGDHPNCKHDTEANVEENIDESVEKVEEGDVRGDGGCQCKERPLSPLLSPKAVQDAAEALLASDFISQRERAAVPEFFSGSSSTRTPERFLRIRQTILGLWIRTRPQPVTKLAARVALRGIAGDVGLISKVHAYLETCALINCSPIVAQKRPPVVVVAPPTGRRPRTRALGPDPFELLSLQPSADRLHVRFAADAFTTVAVHAFLSRQEVIGVLGGHFDAASKSFLVSAVFPCQSAIASGMECELDAFAELRACDEFRRKGCHMLGWYHSHPVFPARPSRRDLQTQLMYQRLFPGHPPAFVGVILSPMVGDGDKRGGEGEDGDLNIGVGCFMAGEQPGGSVVGERLDYSIHPSITFVSPSPTNAPDHLSFLDNGKVDDAGNKENNVDNNNDAAELMGRLQTLLETCVPSSSSATPRRHHFLTCEADIERLCRFLARQLPNPDGKVPSIRSLLIKHLL